VQKTEQFCHRTLLAPWKGSLPSDAHFKRGLAEESTEVIWSQDCPDFFNTFSIISYTLLGILFDTVKFANNSSSDLLICWTEELDFYYMYSPEE
jgi:hypothetical protein